MADEKRRPGRPRKGPDGSSVRGLPVLSVRLPVPVMARLLAVSKMRGVAPSTVIAAALEREFAALDGAELRAVGTLARNEAERLRARFPD